MLKEKKMINILIFGAPGSGKGTQSKKIAEKYGLEHISTGDILRNEIANHTKLGEIAEHFIKEGQLVPDEHVVAMLEKHIDEKHNQVKGFIFDGFPRTIAQADALKEMLDRHGYDISLMINLDVPEDELKVRLIKRGEVSGRSDDNEEAISKRLVEYYNKTEPLIEYYLSRGLFTPVKGVGSIDEIFERISHAIEQKSGLKF